jgi:hypothetical protein
MPPTAKAVLPILLPPEWVMSGALLLGGIGFAGMGSAYGSRIWAGILVENVLGQAGWRRVRMRAVRAAGWWRRLG